MSSVLARVLWLIFLFSIGFFALHQPSIVAPAFVVPEVQVRHSEKPFYRDELLPIAAPSVHAPTLAELPDGRLLAAWFAGSREGAGDVRIVLSQRPAARQSGTWTMPRIVASREQTARDTRRNVRKLGNPVLFSNQGQLHLFYVSASMGGWAGSSINYRRSLDDGEHWTPATRLITSPFLNVSTLVRTPPLALADGSLVLPVYHELFTKHGEWLHLTTQGRVLGMSRIPLDQPSLQPTVVALDAQRALALLRDASPESGRVLASITTDGGDHWKAAPALPLSNPNSSLAMIRLQDGRLLLAANPGEGRHILNLWISDDGGTHWGAMKQVDGPEARFLPDRRALQGDPDTRSTLPDASETASSGPALTDETSYPALLQTHDGLIVLAYSWHRARIRVLTFNTRWLEQGTAR